MVKLLLCICIHEIHLHKWPDENTSITGQLTSRYKPQGKKQQIERWIQLNEAFFPPRLWFWIARPFFCQNKEICLLSYRNRCSVANFGQFTRIVGYTGKEVRPKKQDLSMHKQNHSPCWPPHGSSSLNNFARDCSKLGTLLVMELKKNGPGRLVKLLLLLGFVPSGTRQL